MSGHRRDECNHWKETETETETHTHSNLMHPPPLDTCITGLWSLDSTQMGCVCTFSLTMEGRMRTLRYTTRVAGLLGPKDLVPLHYFALGPSKKVVDRGCRQGHYKNKVPIQGGTITRLLPLVHQNMW
jgi:hypothetical protein